MWSLSASSWWRRPSAPPRGPTVFSARRDNSLQIVISTVVDFFLDLGREDLVGHDQIESVGKRRAWSKPQ
jgi:hypothetical protein